MSPEPVHEFIISGHVRFEMERRVLDASRRVTEAGRVEYQTTGDIH